MPSGLDGCPNPTRSSERDAVIDTVADLICDRHRARTLVGVDGRSGSGKSTFSDELAGRLVARGVEVVRSTTDSFHRPRDERMKRGDTSAEGYYLDSHQLDRIVDELLRPFREGSTRVLVAAFDEPLDSAAETVREIPPTAVLVFDGLFLHRPELLRHWDASVLLEADGRCDRRWLDFVLADLPHGPTERANELDRRLERARWPRYRHGWSTYAATVDPRAKASVTVDNNDIARPRIAATH